MAYIWLICLWRISLTVSHLWRISLTVSHLRWISLTVSWRKPIGARVGVSTQMITNGIYLADLPVADIADCILPVADIPDCILPVADIPDCISPEVDIPDCILEEAYRCQGWCIHPNDHQWHISG